MRNLDVEWAVIPCAGHGTRFLPITKGVPKEMCPIVDRPTVDYIVEELIDAGIKNIISTDISRDGTMTGANLNLYENLNKISGLNITASGGVNSLDDINKLANLKIYGAIVGKAYYTGAINIKSAIEVAHNAH